MNDIDDVFAELKKQVLETVDMSGELEDEKIGDLIDEAIINMDDRTD